MRTDRRQPRGKPGWARKGHTGASASMAGTHILTPGRSGTTEAWHGDAPPCSPRGQKSRWPLRCVLTVRHPRRCESVQSQCVFQHASRKSVLLACFPSHSAGGKGSRPGPPKRQACVSVLKILICSRGLIPRLSPPTDPTSFEDSGLFVTHQGVPTMQRKLSARRNWTVIH